MWQDRSGPGKCLLDLYLLSPAGSVSGFPEAEGSLHGWILSEVQPAVHCNRWKVSSQSICHMRLF